MKAHILDKLNRLMVDAKKTPENVHQDLGFAVSTVRRWLKGETAPDLDDLTTMVEYLGGSMNELFAEVGKQELAAAQTIDYKGTDVLVAQYEARLEAMREKHEIVKSHHDKSVEYLRDEIERLRSERADLIGQRDALSAENAATKASMEAEIRKAKSTASDIIGKKQAVYWVQAILNILLAAGWIIAMMTDSVI